MKSRIYLFFAGYALLVFVCFAVSPITPAIAISLYIGYLILCYALMRIEYKADGYNEGEEA